MAKAKPKFRKSIRTNGKILQERFYRREDAERWYRELYNQRAFSKHGLAAPVSSDLTFARYALEFWLPKRKRDYEEPTWRSDEQRLNDYLIPKIGHLTLASVRGPKIRSLLNDLVTEEKLSVQTRDRVRALISAIYNSAINHDPPLAEINPTFGLRFSHKRVGNKKPSNIESSEKTLLFLKAAKELSQLHLAYAALFIMSGPRKQEGIALMWDCISVEDQIISYKRKYLQASKKIVVGTKGGTEASREVPIPKELARILSEWREQSKFNSDDDFVFTTKDGGHWSPRMFSTIHAHICKKAGIIVTIHGLRHTFGREFAQRSKNIRALQEILGHSSITTTQLYSELGKDRLKTFQETVSFELGDSDDDQ